MIYLGNVKDYVTSELKQEAESLFLKTNSHIRNKETHFRNCINGLCAEVALNKFFKLQKNVSEDLYYDSYDENNKKFIDDLCILCNINTLYTRNLCILCIIYIINI